MSVLNAKHFHDEEAAFAELEAQALAGWPGLPALRRRWTASMPSRVSHQAQQEAPEGVVRHGLKKCGHCRKQFTVRVGTIFEDSHVPLHKWLQAIHLMASSKKGISSHQLHRMLEVSVQHRLVHGAPHPRGHARWRLSASDGRRWRRRGDRRNHVRPRRHASQGPPPWFMASSRASTRTSFSRWWSAAASVRSYHVEGSTVAQVIPIVYDNIDHEAQVMTDAAQLYKYRLERLRQP